MSRFSNQPEVTITLSGYIHADSGKALKFELHEVAGSKLAKEKQKKFWLPISQLKSMTRQPPGSDELDIVVAKDWIWKQKVQEEYGGKDPREVSAASHFGADDDLDIDQLDELGLNDDPPF